ncbi:hypothetical protein CK203_102763 [Vitis vinifera]|uniref:Uncharacterized protein n=1 Tax=Vitis vinifera TaxID=29760 RepID=A0A438FFF3_VITVI|nr:hypothetical protein CK203_102763 [Vitis vinifera]
MNTLVEECPTIPTAREMFGDQANVIGQFKPNNNASYGNTYNSSWRNHPNFSWKPRAPQYQQSTQPSQQASSLEQAIVNLSKKIDNLQYSISRLTNLNTVQEKGDFLLNLAKTPRVSMKWKLMRENLHSHDWRKGSGKALLDLGASVNLLPYSVYKQLGLGELKPTSITLSLADRSVKIPRGIIEDVLVQVDNFYYPLITPEEEEGPEEVCIIDTLVEEHCNQNMQDKLNESLGILKKGCLNPLMCLLLYKVGGGEKRFYLCSIKRRHKKLLRRDPKAQFEASAHGVEIHIPEEKTMPVVISSSLTTHQEIST